MDAEMLTPSRRSIHRPKQIDWDRYVDEDEEQENPSFDMSQLEGGMVRALGDGVRRPLVESNRLTNQTAHKNKNNRTSAS